MSADNGMALAITIAMILLVSVPGVLFGTIGYFVGKARLNAEGRVPAGEGSREAFGVGAPKAKSRKPILFAFGGFLIGVLGGVIAIVFTFFESTFDSEIVFQVPAGFAHEDIFVIEDPSSRVSFDWNTTRTEARVPVPPSGVVRVTDLEDFAGGPLSGRLSTGETNRGGSSQPPPAPLPGVVLLCFSFQDWEATHPSDCGREDVGEIIRRREGH